MWGTRITVLVLEMTKRRLITLLGGHLAGMLVVNTLTVTFHTPSQREAMGDRLPHIIILMHPLAVQVPCYIDKIMIWLLGYSLKLVEVMDNKMAIVDDFGIPFLVVFPPSPVHTRYRTASAGPRDP